MYLLALKVAPLEVGVAYDVLPSHCTLVHRFWSDLGPEELTNKLKPLLNAANPPQLIFEDKETFGPPPVIVNKVAVTAELGALHQELCERLNRLGVEYTAPQWIGEGYKAHVTERAGVVFEKGHIQKSSAVYMIEIMTLRSEKTRVVRSEFVLGKVT